MTIQDSERGHTRIMASEAKMLTPEESGRPKAGFVRSTQPYALIRRQIVVVTQGVLDSKRSAGGRIGIGGARG